MKVAQELKEAHIPWQVGFAETPKYPQIGLQQRKEALRSILMHVPTGIFLLGVIDKVMHIALERTIAAGRIRIEPTARVDGEVGRFLHRLDGKVRSRTFYLRIIFRDLSRSACVVSISRSSALETRLQSFF